MGVVEDHLLTIARTSQAVGDTRYLQEFRGQVEEVSGTRLKVKRPDQGEAFWAPLVASSHKPKAGDWVRGYQFHGQAIILGADGKASDKDVPALDIQKLARDGTQPMTGTLAVQRALAGASKAMHALKATDGDEVQLQLTTGGALRLFNQTTAKVLADFRRDGQFDALLLPNAVTGREIADLAVSRARMVDNAVNFDKLANNSVWTTNLFDVAVTGPKIADNAVGTRVINSGGVQNANLGDNAVGSRVLAGGAVDTGHLSGYAVTNIKINTNAVDSRVIAGGAVSSGHIQSNNVGYSQIAAAISGDDSATGASSARGNKALRKLLGSGTGLAAASADHTHSVQFDTMGREIREMYIEKRRKVREIRDETEDGEKRGLASMVLALCHLLMDDEDFDAEERERRLRDDPEFREAFAQKHTHEYPDARGRGGQEAEPRRRRADGNLLRAHPDVAE